VSDVRRPALALLLAYLLLVAGVSALDGYDYYQTIEYAGCDQEIYQQDIVIHRSTGTAYNETAGGLETWHIYVGEHCREDYGDVRFTNSTGAELTYYLWPDYDNSSARFCVRLEGATTAGTLMVYYGNPTAATTSDPDATYIFHDNFEHDVIGAAPSKWSVSQGSASTVTVSTTAYTGSKSALLRSNDDSQGIATKEITFPPTFRVEFSGLAMQTSSVLTGVYVDSSTFEINVAYWDDGLIKYNDGGTWRSTGKPYQKNIWLRHILIIDNVARKYRVIIPDMGIDVSDISFRTGNAVDRLRMLTGASAKGDTYVDDILVRAYSATPPAATTFSGEQETAAVLQPFPGLTNIPRDLAGNGLYTDINGNNRLDYNDLTVFFQNLAWAKTAQPIACFDFNGNGWLDYNDVITLFSTITEEHT
jgi:large repetitive protein